MAVWGSKVSNLGSKIPACSQKQKMALLVPGFQTLFLLAVPPNSHKFLREYVERAKAYNINLADIITRISFVAGVQGTLLFNPAKMPDNSLPYIDEPTAILRQAARAEKKTDVLVGRNDVPRTTALAAPVQQPVQITSMQMLPVNSTPQQVAEAFANIQQPAQQVQQPAPFIPPNGSGAGQFLAASQTTQVGPAAAPQQPAAEQQPEPAATPRRRRRTAAEMQAAQPSQPAPAAAQAAPQAPFPHPAAAPQQLDAFPVSPPATQGAAQPVGEPQFGMAPGTPAAANPEVSAMLDNFFKQG